MDLTLSVLYLLIIFSSPTFMIKIRIVFFQIAFLILLFTRSYDSSSQSISRKPYLQQPTPTGIVIRWRTDTPSETLFRFSDRINGDQRVISESSKKLDHSIKLTNLVPGKTYYYEVRHDAGDWEKNSDYFYKTQSLDINEPVHFWAMGDFGDLSNPTYIGNQTAVYKQFLANRPPHTDLWLWLGDVGYGNNKELLLQNNVFDFYKTSVLSNTPLVTAPGNHEYYINDAFQRTNKNIVYFDFISPPVLGEAGGLPSNNKSYYSINYGPVHIVSLDSYGMEDGKLLYDVESKQYKWFENDLAQNKSKWTIVIFHHPPYTKRAHDSDAEEELQLMRRFIVPVMDKYNVDLVLSGHSHIYERSYLMKNHLESAEGFNYERHVVQKTLGGYNSKELPFINKTEGTIYCVAGSGGRLELPSRSTLPPHPAMVYSNIEMGGSVLIKVQNNRLDLKWLATDGTIPDQFTMFKEVNRTQKLEVVKGQSLSLRASWPGSYRWSHTADRKQNISSIFQESTVVTVSDSLNYLRDRFEITVINPPKILTKAQIEPKKVYCMGDSVRITGGIQNLLQNKTYTYILELVNDKNSNFVLNKWESPRPNFSIILPKLEDKLGKFKFRIAIKGEEYNGEFSSIFEVKERANVEILSPLSIPFDTLVKVQIKALGSFPIQLTLDKLGSREITTELSFLSFNPRVNAQFIIKEVQNICGLGTKDEKVITVLPPLGTETNSENKWMIFPNPAKSFLNINHPSYNEYGKVKIVTLNGKIVKSWDKILFVGNNTQINLKGLNSGKYIIKIETKSSRFSSIFVLE